MYVLHHPAAPRRLPEPAIRVSRARSRESGACRRARGHPDRPGYYLLRLRLGPARRLAPAARGLGTGARALLGALSLLLSEPGHAPPARDHCSIPQACEVHGHAAAAREPPRSTGWASSATPTWTTRRASRLTASSTRK